MNGSLISTSGFLGRRGRTWTRTWHARIPDPKAVLGRCTSGRDFTKPFKSASKTTFKFVSGEGGTTVVWQVLTPKSLATRIFGIFMNFDKMVGGDLERGLAKLKTVAE